MKRLVRKHLPCILATLFVLFALSAFGQHDPVEQTMEYPKADIEKALKQLPGFPEGKLPIVDGFVIPGNEPLEGFQRAYYSVSSVVVPSPLPNQTTIKITAKITAWYSGDSATKPGYQALHSNGRIESDLFDQLKQLLPARSSTDEQAGRAVSKQLASRSLPDAPDSRVRANSATITSGQLPSLTSLKAPAVSASDISNSRTTKPPDENAVRIKQLSDEKNALEEIARNQSHPDNLASVIASHTPVMTQPAAGAHVLFYADAQDEFTVLGMKENWVHVTVSGISRGWVRRSQMDLSTISSEKIVAATAAQSSREPFRSTREETSPFPGTWEALQGKAVKVIWVEPSNQAEASAKLRLKYAMSLMRKASQAKAATQPEVEGVVVVFDSAEGGMAAATTASLKRWQAGNLSDESFEKQCWFNPVEAFVNSQQ